MELGDFSYVVNDHPDESCIKYKVTAGLLAAVFFVLSVFWCIYSVKFVKIYGMRSKWLIMFLIMLVLSALSRMVALFIEVTIRRHYCVSPFPKWGEGINTFFNLGVFLSAIVFWLFNWLYQINDINNLMHPRRNYKIIIDLLLIVIQTVIFVIVCLMFVLSWACENKNHVIRTFAIVFSVFYFCIGIIFPICGYIFYKKLKLFSYKKSREMKTRILLSAIFISISFILRGWFNIIRISVHFDSKFRIPSQEDNKIGYPIFMIFYYIIVEITPIVFQMVSVKWVVDNHNLAINRKSDTLKCIHKDSVDSNKTSLVESEKSDANEDDNQYSRGEFTKEFRNLDSFIRSTHDLTKYE